jgi:hypothetical protein
VAVAFCKKKFVQDKSIEEQYLDVGPGERAGIDPGQEAFDSSDQDGWIKRGNRRDSKTY